MISTSLEVDDVVAGYIKGIDIIRDVSIRVRESRITSIVGPNGAGKSTLLKTIFGYLRPIRGKILFNGRDITYRKPFELLHLGIAYVPQERSIFPYMTVKENLELGAWIHRHEKGRVRKAISDVYKKFPALEEKKDMSAGTLSGGMQRMLELARALMVKTSLLLVDEPTTALAPKIGKGVYDALKMLANGGVTVVLVDQNVRKALEVCDYMYILDLGEVKQHGPKKTFEKTMDETVRSWLGTA